MRFLRPLLVLLLLFSTTTACVSEDQLQRWGDEITREATSALQQWLQETIDSMVDEATRQASDWWEDTQRESTEAIRDWWNGLGEAVDESWQGVESSASNLWADLFPPPPVILEPRDGIESRAGSLVIRGTGLPGSTITIQRNGQPYAVADVDARGEWQDTGVVLNKGENRFTASARKRLWTSSLSPTVSVSYPGSDLGRVPALTPNIPDNHNLYSWMADVALASLSERGETFYTTRRSAFVSALHAGIEASRQDYEAHRFINPEVPLASDAFSLVLLAAADATEKQIVEALLKAVESAVLDRAVQYELQRQIAESFVLLQEEWFDSDAGITYAFQYVRIDLDREYVLRVLDPSAMAKFRAQLGTELTKGLVGELSGRVAAKAVKMGFAIWGTADADRQAQHYFELAIRAWNHRGLAGEPLSWADPRHNGFDGGFTYDFATNEEWAMFYLGRALLYAQSPADPYYAIPHYKPDADLYAFLAHKATSLYAQRLVAQKAEAVYGKVISGGAGPITILFTARELLDWMLNFERNRDAREVRDTHRLNFEAFMTGEIFSAPMPEGVRNFGATTPEVGYPFRGPNDILIHRYLTSTPAPVWQREEQLPDLIQLRDVLALYPGENVGWENEEIWSIVRRSGQESARYIHPGNVFQSDQRIPEGDMIYGSTFLVREVYNCHRQDAPGSSCWAAPVGTRLRLTWLDGSIIEGTVQTPPDEFEDLISVDGMGYQTRVQVRMHGLDNLSYMAGTRDTFPFHTITLMSLTGDEQHMYAILDARGARPGELASVDAPDLAQVLAGISGNRTLPDLVEADGSAHIAADRLLTGILISEHLLGRFAKATATPLIRNPVILGPGELGIGGGSPVTFHLYDRQGRHVGLADDGRIDLEIPGARYFTNQETGKNYIVVPAMNLNSEYTLKVKGTGAGAFDLDVLFGDRQRQEMVRLHYVDIPVQADTQVELVIERDSEHNLQVDSNGDREINFTVAPAQITRSPILELDDPSPLWPYTLAGATAGIFILLLIWRLVRRRRRVAVAPVAVLPVCARCGTVARRANARFCATCGAPLA